MIFYQYHFDSEDGYEPSGEIFYAIVNSEGRGDFMEMREGISPEDVMFGRDLSFVYDIPELVTLAYKFGTQEMISTEKLEIVKKEFDDSEEFEDACEEIKTFLKKAAAERVAKKKEELK